MIQIKRIGEATVNSCPVDSTLFVAWTMVGSASLTLAAVHGGLWSLDPRRTANLAFCALAVSVAAIARIEYGMMRAATAADYAQWLRWLHAALFMMTASLVAFVYLHLGTARAWLGWTIVALRGVVAAANVLGSGTASWHVMRLDNVPLLGDQAATSGLSTVRPLQWLATTTTVLVLVFVVDASIRLWREPGPEVRRKALVVGGSITAFALVALLQSQLVIWEFVRMPVMLSPPFLIILAAMTYELCRDIVASARIEAEARRLREELAHVARVSTLSELSGALAHELNQPLTAILSNAQAAQRLLANKAADPEMLSEILADIVAADKRAGEVIDGLRGLFKRGATQIETLDANRLVQEVMSLAQGDLATRGIAASLQLQPRLPEIRGDRVQLEQVLLNLVVNAIEAMAGCAPKDRQLLVRTAATQGRVHINVVDRGPGFDVPPARLFEKFYTTKAKGLGLGLSISRSIITAHHGVLRATARRSGGAAFLVTLPALPAR